MLRRGVCLSLIAVALPLFAEVHKTRNLILVTVDGLRWQEVFEGIDTRIPNKQPIGAPGERPEQLFPFFWNVIGRRGVVMHARVTNSFRVSYPGYSEILTGRAQDDAVRGNDPIQNPGVTVLEFLKKRLGVTKREVALFGSWERFQQIGEHTKGSIVLNAGYQKYDGPGYNVRMRDLSQMQFDVRTPFPEVRHDYITLEMALEYWRTQKPRVLYVALGEPDDWAHERRYDRYIQSAVYFDTCLKKLWEAMDPATTTMIVTSDHGRGDTADDWHSHGKDVAGAERIWIGVAGPDTAPAGIVKDVVEQRDIAPTILEFFGIDHKNFEGATGKPIRAVLPGARPALQ